MKKLKNLKKKSQKLLSYYENKIDKSKKETKEIIDIARKAQSEKIILEQNGKVSSGKSEVKKKSTELKIAYK